MPKKTKRTKGQIGGKVAGYKTWAEYEKSPYYQENLKAGRNDLLADMKRSYEPDWKPPADIVEKTRPYYRNPDKETAFDRFMHKNSSAMLKGLFGKAAGVLGVPSEVGNALGGFIGDTLEKANREGAGRRRRPHGKHMQHGSGSTHTGNVGTIRF